MTKQLILLFSLFLVVACNSCAPQLPPAPPPDVVDAGPPPPPVPPMPPQPPVVVVDAGPEPVVDSSVRDACAAMASAGCAEGISPACMVKLQQAVASRLTNVPLACLVSAHTKSAVHACGKFVPCL